LITATCEAGPETKHMCTSTFEICLWSLQILGFVNRCVFNNSIFGLSKCNLYIEIMKYLKSSCQGSNHHPFNGLWSILVQKDTWHGLIPQPSDLLTVHLTTTLWRLHTSVAKCNKVKKKINFFSENEILHVFCTQINKIEIVSLHYFY
jgi:hypothetical protein